MDLVMVTTESLGCMSAHPLPPVRCRRLGRPLVDSDCPIICQADERT